MKMSIWMINDCIEEDNFVLLKVNTGENILFYECLRGRGQTKQGTMICTTLNLILECGHSF